MTNTITTNPVSTGAEIERKDGAVDNTTATAEHSSHQLEKLLTNPNQMIGFMNHVADNGSGAENTDAAPRTFNDMTDEELMKNLSDFLGSGAINTSINGAHITLASDMAAERAMSEEQLAELPNPKTPAGVAARIARVRETVEKIQEEQERRMEERRAEWDAEIHDFGGERLSGAEIMRRIDWYNKPENKQRIRDDLKKQGLNDQQIKDIEKDVERRNALYLLMRDGKATEAEKQEYEVLNNSAGVKRSDESVSKNLAADVGRKNNVNEDINMTRQTPSVSNQVNVSADAAVAKPVAEKSAAYQDFPSAEGIEIRKNFAGAAAANTNTTVAAPAPVVVAAASVSTAKVESSFAF